MSIKRISAALKKYNANTRYTNTGDCVKRSLSLAYGMDYDDVSNELNRIKRQLHYSQYNVSPVFNTFIEDHGVIRKASGRIYSTLADLNLPDDTTVKQFSELIKDGTYVILCGESKSSSTHMVCVLNGDIWDSWDSSNYFVNKIYVIEESKSDEPEKFLAEDISYDLQEYIMNYLNSIQEKKMPWAKFELAYTSGRSLDNYGFAIDVKLVIGDKDTLSKLGMQNTAVEYKTFVCRISPRLSKDANLNKMKEKLRYQAREWAWSIRRLVEDRIKESTMEVNPRFKGEKSILLKMPDAAKPNIIRIYDRGSNEYCDRYYAEMIADKADPRYTPSDPYVEFYGDNITELKYNISQYLKDYSRIGYDY